MKDTVEHRYYRNPNNMVAITYLQKFGEAFLPLRGHWHVNGTSIDLCNCQCGPNSCHPAIETLGRLFRLRFGAIPRSLKM